MKISLENLYLDLEAESVNPFSPKRGQSQKNSKFHFVKRLKANSREIKKRRDDGGENVA